MLPEEKAIIAQAVNKLFVLQGQNPTKEKTLLFVDELSDCGYNLKSVLETIQSLYSQDLKFVKLSNILDVLKRKKIDRLEREETERVLLCSRNCDEKKTLSTLGDVARISGDNWHKFEYKKT